MKQQNTNNGVEYINNEITTYKTNKKLLAFSDRMNIATAVNYANLHSKGEKGEQGRKIYSTIGILASDFSCGKGESNIRAEANISPSEARFIFVKMESYMLHCLSGEIFQSSKIFGNADKQGYASMRLLKISREQADGDGEVKKYPWTIAVDNGSAIKASGANGSTYAKSGTFKSQRKVMVNLSDQDFYCLLAEVVAYINVWEVTFAPKVVREGRGLLDVKMAEAIAEAEKNPKPKSLNSSPRQSASQPKNTSGIDMTLEQARSVKIPFGTKKGKTLGEVEAEGLYGVEWYITKMTVDNPKLRNAAQVILDSHNCQNKAG
ncbi:MAG: hypothetical protein FWE05_11890 [Defluviitaleaceae bacterium]|nr:hypothetical protein [Defluviitaleaceae bacterium]